MRIRIDAIEPDEYARYDRISNAFTVETVLQVGVIKNGLYGFSLSEEKLIQPYLKDYNLRQMDNPSAWMKNFDLSRWGIFLATIDEREVGGAAVSEDPSMLPFHTMGSAEIAVLWDIRVLSTMRKQGIGGKLFHYAIEWAQNHGCKQLWLETSNINVPACRFYARQGCQLGAIHRFGYSGIPEVAHEVMLLWYYDL